MPAKKYCGNISTSVHKYEVFLEDVTFLVWVRRDDENPATMGNYGNATADNPNHALEVAKEMLRLAFGEE